MSRYTEKEIDQILELSSQGLSSRKIAKKLDRSKSGINYLLERQRAKPKNRPKILLLDLETSPSIAAVFGRFKQNVSHEAIIKEGGWLVSYACKWLGEKKIISSVLTSEEARDSNDLRLCTELHDLIEQADYIVAHNLFGFDLPVIKTRVILNNLPPIKKVKGICTLVIAKEFRFNSNKLDALCKQLELPRKVSHDGISMWIGSMNGIEKELKKMLGYNLGDIPTLEELYLTLRPYSTRHPNLAVNYGDKIRCNLCISSNIKETGNNIMTSLSVFPEYKCCDCGARFRGRKSKTTKEERSNFLSN